MASWKKPITLKRAHPLANLDSIATDEAAEAPTTDDDDEEEPKYFLREGGLWWNKMLQTRKGWKIIPTQLTNFIIKITADVTIDDGTPDHAHYFDLEAKQGEHQVHITIAAREYDAFRFPTEKIGAHAVISAGQGLRDHTREAVQLLSAPVPQRTRYGHTGWHKINGVWGYLDANGAIGSGGRVEGVEVTLHDSLALLKLELPEDKAAAKRAVRASLDLLNLGLVRITAPLLGAAYTAPLPMPHNYSVWLWGDTGRFKSESITLAMQHFGRDWAAPGLPSFKNTSNFNKALAFQAKDALLPVDDYKPSGSPMDRQRMAREAEDLIRSQGNSASRGRMRADSTLQPDKPPRCLLLASGEEILSLESSRARMLIVEVSERITTKKNLTVAQEAGKGGCFAQATGAYVKWLAARHDRLVKTLAVEHVRLRALAGNDEQHPRTPDLIARVALGWAAFLSFSVNTKALTMKQAEKLWLRAWAALIQGAADQDKHQQAAKPAQRFSTLLTQAVASGVVYLKREIEPPQTFAVEKDNRVAVGWITLKGEVYLIPDAAYTAASRLGELVVGPTSVWKQMHESGLLSTTDIEKPGRKTYPVRRRLEARTVEVLHVKPEVVGLATPAPAEEQNVGKNPTNVGSKKINPTSTKSLFSRLYDKIVGNVGKNIT